MSENSDANRSELAPGLPMVVEPQRPRPSLLRNTTQAAFVSQLLAARANLTTQRVKRRNSVDLALNAYRTGATIAVMRMPQGYRKTVVA